MAKQFIISIGREYGSGGRVIAEKKEKRYYTCIISYEKHNFTLEGNNYGISAGN